MSVKKVKKKIWEPMNNQFMHVDDGLWMFNQVLNIYLLSWSLNIPTQTVFNENHQVHVYTFSI